MTNIQDTLELVIELIISRHPEMSAGILDMIKDASKQTAAESGRTHKDIEANFTKIYNTNKWGNKESVSGAGSTLEYTKNLRQKLPILFDKYSILSVFDAPCGDFNWMRHVVEACKIDYVGGDIVRPLIDVLCERYQSDRVRFCHVDITKDPLPSADLMICRDCLIHLSFDQTKSFLNNFVRSRIPYLLTTSHVNNGGLVNRDIEAGGFRHIDLFSSPYNFTTGFLMEIEDWSPPFRENKMYLWERGQVIEALSRFGN